MWHYYTRLQVSATAQIFFLAGMETTAHAATWVLFQLSQHPEVEAALERELDEAGLLVAAARPHPRALEHADLAGLVYLQAVVKARMSCGLRPRQRLHGWRLADSSGNQLSTMLCPLARPPRSGEQGLG